MSWKFPPSSVIDWKWSLLHKYPPHSHIYLPAGGVTYTYPSTILSGNCKFNFLQKCPNRGRLEVVLCPDKLVTYPFTSPTGCRNPSRCRQGNQGVAVMIRRPFYWWVTFANKLTLTPIKTCFIQFSSLLKGHLRTVFTIHLLYKVSHSTLMQDFTTPIQAPSLQRSQSRLYTSDYQHSCFAKSFDTNEILRIFFILWTCIWSNHNLKYTKRPASELIDTILPAVYRVKNYAS